MEEFIRNLSQKLKVPEFWNNVIQVFTQTLFKLGNTPVTLIKVIYLLFSLWAVVFISKFIVRFIDKRVLSHGIRDSGFKNTFTTIIRYLFIIFGFLFVITSAGFDLGSLGTAAAALGVGIGFGLQNITNNFISGLIILFERPIKVGDRIEVGQINGDVTSISMRATKIITNDNINVIVPNSDLINNKVINWSYNERRVRFKFPVGVGYNEDPEKVKEIVLKVAKENKGILEFPEPQLWFDEYGDNSLNFKLVVWTSTYIQKPSLLKSELYYEIFKAFKKNNIEIPFPQRDLHIKDGLENFYPFKENLNQEAE